MYDDKDSEVRRCDNCLYENYKGGVSVTCNICSNSHMETPKGPRLPFWAPIEFEEISNGSA